jgi:hypothetical protein
LLALREEIESLQAARAALHDGDHPAAAGESRRSANGAGSRPNDVKKYSRRQREGRSPRTPRTRVPAVGRRRRRRQRSSGAVLSQRLESVLLEHGELSSAALAGLVDADQAGS